MKILQVCDLAPYKVLGGLAFHAITLSNLLFRAGHTVTFLGNGLYGTVENVRMMDFHGHLILSSNLGASQWLRRSEFYGGIYNFVYHKHVAKKIAREIEKYGEEYDVVHYHGHYPTVGMRVSERINFVETHHDYGTFCPKKVRVYTKGGLCASEHHIECAECYSSSPNMIQKAISAYGARLLRDEMRISLNRHKHIFVSQRLMDTTMAFFKVKETSNGYVLHNFVDCARIRREVEKESMHPKIGPIDTVRIYIANTLVGHKGVGLFLKYIKEMPGTNRLSITIAGEGPERIELERKYAAENVTFAGWLPYGENIRQMYKHDIYVLPSVWEESCSTSVIEALYLGKEVRALNLGGTPELKMYAEHPNQLKLYANLEHMVQDLVTGRHVYQSGSKARAGFNACVERQADRILEVYEK